MSWTVPSHDDNSINSVGLLKQKFSTMSTNKIISLYLGICSNKTSQWSQQTK